MKGSIIVVCIVLCLINITNGTIIHVPGDYPTIQQGLNAASTGDTVLVAAGTYTENIFWPLINGIKLYSESGANVTIIDGDTVSTVIYLSGLADIDTTTVIRGFTIQNGYGDPYGGGIYLVNSSPKIENNTIRYNYATQLGGGICCIDTSLPLIINNTITMDSAGWGGGGVACIDSSGPTITGNTIITNWGGYGGGIYCADSGCVITGNQIIDNTAGASGFAGDGGGIFCDGGSKPLIDGNRIANNSTVGGYHLGGGIYCGGNSKPLIVNDTIIANSVDNGGGGIFCDGTDTLVISGCVIDSNSAVMGTGGGIFCDNCHPIIAGNRISNNTAIGYTVLSGGGIYLDFSDAEITGNTITANISYTGAGIYCRWSDPKINHNVINANTAYRKGGGICCETYSNPQIRFNTITQNDADSLGDGIYCLEGSFPVIDSNDIYNNGYGAYNADNSQMLMAENNWWGDSTGPYHPGLNPTGLGDSTNIFVDPVPWLYEPVGVKEEIVKKLSAVNIIAKNNPNPFNQITYIHYQCLEASRVTIEVYNTLGQKITTLLNKIENPGEHSIKWDAYDLSAGVYFYRVTVGHYTSTRKCLLIK
jgi:hypothetical protein